MSDTIRTNTSPTPSDAAMPTVFVLFGATGDLMERKVLPALFHLYKKQHLPEYVSFVGFSRNTMSTEAYQQFIAEVLKNHSDITTDTNDVRAFLEHFSYVRGLFEEEKDYQSLAHVLESIDTNWGTCSNKLFYLGVPPQFYETIANNLAHSGMTKPCSPEEGWTRVIVEKPFGKDRNTAQKIDETFASLFKEEQIYRIDHYLGKEMVQNILTFRFANNLFGASWHTDHIERIHIRLNETIGVQNRGSFYDSVGALRDVGQNHLLQVLALLTMETPPDFSASAIRSAREKILTALPARSAKAAGDNIRRAQYDGYQDVDGVSPDSYTETYFRVETALHTPRWRNTAIILEGGKRLPDQQKDAVVTFRHPDPCLCPQKGHFKNTVHFTFGDDERIAIRFLAKEPGAGFTMSEGAFDFLFHKETDTRHMEDYESLLLDCIRGDQTLFVSTNEVMAMWRFIDPIISEWENNTVPLETYEPGTFPKAKNN